MNQNLCYALKFKMKTKKTGNWPILCLLIMSSMVFDAFSWRLVQATRFHDPAPAQIIKKSNSSTLNVMDFHSSVEELEESIVSWTGTHVHQTPMKSQSPNRRKTKSGLLIESNITEKQIFDSTKSTSNSSTRAAKKFTQRRRNGPLQGLRSSINANGNDPKDSDYVLASRIVQTWLFQSNRSNDNIREPLDLSFEAGHVEIIFQHESVPKSGDWVAVCGHDYKASFDSTWRSDLCITKHLMENITRCICPLSGTYVVMLTKRQANTSQSLAPHQPIFVIVSCACCLLQCCSAFLILLPIWCNRKCAVTFLKMQFCISTSSVMLIYLLGFLKMLPVNWHGIISSSLASLLLLGISTLIAIALVIHTELVPKKYLQIGSKPPTPTKQSKRSESPNNITQISVQSPEAVATNSAHIRRHQPPSSASSNSNSNSNSGTGFRSSSGSSAFYGGAAGIRGAIGISWLLPLLFAIAAPLICSIIGKCPRHWWLEMLWTRQPTDAASDSSSGSAESTEFDAGVYYATHTLLNGDNLMLESEAMLGNGTVRQHATSALTEPSSMGTGSDSASVIGSGHDVATSASSITANSELSSTDSELGAVTAAALTWPQQQTPVAWHRAPVHQYGHGHAEAAAFTSGLGVASATPSLSFVLFICIDLLFILLFFALFVILMKKLLWMWHKNRNVHTHPLDKFNIALRRRMGLLYRTGGLLLIKLCTDGCFIVYVNSMPDTLWAYPFGISCILLGFGILFCFVIKAESQLRGPPFLGSNGSSQNSSLKQTKFNTSKTSLDENYCTTTTASINSPLSFYTNHDKEKESECVATTAAIVGGNAGAAALQPKQGLELSAATGTAAVQLPLTIISTAPRCQSAAVSTADSLLSGHQQLPLTVAASPATRCCALLSGGNANAAGALGYAYDAYTMGGLTGSLGRRMLHQQPARYTRGPCGEFLGVETLDILQGLAPDSIIGIHASGMMPATATHYMPLQHNPYVDFVPSPLMLSMPPPTLPPPTISGKLSGAGIGMSSATLPTPKTQKRVTIQEPTSRATFDPLLPTMVAAVVSTTSTATTTLSLTPATQSAGVDSSSGLGGDATLDRITHDLDYLLNRGSLDVDTASPPPPPPPSVLIKKCDDTQQSSKL